MLDAAAADDATMGLQCSTGETLVQQCGACAAWYVVSTEWQSERLAATAARDLGFQTFLPLIRRRIPATRLRAERTETVPAFPGYLFALWSEGDCWQRLRQDRHVASILTEIGNPLVPAQVPAGAMMVLLSRGGITGVINDLTVPELLPPLGVGEEARITRGTLEGQRGIVEWSSDERVALLFEIMGGKRRVTMRRDHVAAIGP